jgi:hypothetical protein
VQFSIPPLDTPYPQDVSLQHETGGFLYRGSARRSRRGVLLFAGKKGVRAMRRIFGFNIMVMGMVAIFIGLGYGLWQICFPPKPRVLFREKVGQLEKNMSRETVFEIMGIPDEAETIDGALWVLYNNTESLYGAKTFEESLSRCIIVLTNDIVKEINQIYSRKGG